MKRRRRVLAGALGVTMLLGAAAYAAADIPTDMLKEGSGHEFAACSRTPKKNIAAGGPKQLASMEELLEFVRKGTDNRYYTAMDLMMVEEAEMAPEASISGSNERYSGFGTSEKDSAGDYSETNSQVSGVEEGDLIKTDGRFIYSLQKDVVRIHRVNGKDITLESEIKQPDNRYTSEMFLSGDRLVTVSNDVYGLRVSEDYGPIKCGTKFYGSRGCAVYTVYDISDRSNPTEVKSFEISGTSVMARVADGSLYFVVNQYLPYIAIDQPEPEPCEVLPIYYDSQDLEAGETVKTVPVTDVCYFPEMESADSYIVVGSMDLDSGGEAVFDTYLSDGHNFYMSRESLYIVSSSWREGGRQTKIYRFDITPEGLQYQAEGKVDGYVLNQYSMDEYDEYFQIATTDSGIGNYIKVLDKDLNIVGSTTALSPDETIQSVRFMGSMAYMVTYRQTDPLYAVDLSDPSDPQVLDALKIPGFSQYLHPLGDDLLVGFGRHTEEIYRKDLNGNEIVVGATDLGAKVSLFDISDPKNLREIDVMFLGEDSFSEAFNNPRALMVNKNKQFFGFFMEEYVGHDYRTYSHDWRNSIKLVSVSDNKLEEMASIDISQKGYDIYGNRLVYIDETLYSLENGELNAYDMKDGYKQIANVKL